jgi:hypothetical protein
MAEALGVHRNWVSELASRGAPGGPPYCELAWRTWMAANNHDAKKQPEAPLLELLAKSGIPQYRKLLAGDQEGKERPSPREVSNQVAITFDERKDKAEADNAESKAALSAIELGQKQKRIIQVDDLHRLVVAIGKLWQPLMHAVPDACLDSINRSAVEQAIATGQEKLVTGIESHLVAFLEEIARG